MGKLVRDGIPAIMRANGREADTRILDETEYLASLFDKLLEEAQELREAPADKQLEELADVYEVLLAIGVATGSSMDDIAAAATRKRNERGGFENRVWLERW